LPSRGEPEQIPKRTLNKEAVPMKNIEVTPKNEKQEAIIKERLAENLCIRCGGKRENYDETFDNPPYCESCYEIEEEENA
jgi:hypothetical protein